VVVPAELLVMLHTPRLSWGGLLPLGDGLLSSELLAALFFLGFFGCSLQQSRMCTTPIFTFNFENFYRCEVGMLNV
jgi:hypothetical protein